jgi:hypothetical protein
MTVYVVLENGTLPGALIEGVFMSRKDAVKLAEERMRMMSPGSAEWIKHGTFDHWRLETEAGDRLREIIVLEKQAQPSSERDWD